MKRVLTVKQMNRFVTQLTKKFYLWHDFQPGRKHSMQRFCVLVRENNFRGSIHITAYGEIHGFNQNSKKPDIMYWSKRYKFQSVAELQKLYTDLYRRLQKTTRTKF
jgi:hypothetical protein